MFSFLSTVALNLSLAILRMVPLASAKSIQLLEPIGGMTSFDTSADSSGCGPGLGPICDYFNALYPWFEGVAGGIAIIWMVWGTFGLIMSGGDQGKRTEAMNTVKGALLGITILLLAHLILHTLNPFAYN